MLLRAAEKLHSAPSLPRFLEEVIEVVAGVAHALTAVALLKDAHGKLTPAVVRHANPLAEGEVLAIWPPVAGG